jgi:hypothetical protein
VTPGVESGSYVITGVKQVVGLDTAEVPEVAHGRRVLFWLDNDAEVRAHVGQQVEITGTFTTIEEAEVELKAGRQESGGLIVEFEGPGRDVRSANPAVSTAVGTAGRVEAERDDVQAYLLRVRVGSVKAMAPACQ